MGRSGRIGSESWRRRAIAFAGILVTIGGLLAYGTVMPGESFRGALPALTERQRALASELRRDVEALAGDVGERNLARPGSMAAAERTVTLGLEAAGHAPIRLPYAVGKDTVANLEVSVRGTTRPDEVVVVGAHYDTAETAPGADDNASGVALLLALARVYGVERVASPPARTLRLVAFANEEPPHFWKASMGSLVYATACKARGDRIVSMVSLESLGFYSDTPGSQAYPAIVRLFYPSRGDFVGFVGDLGSRGLVHRTLGTFRGTTKFPSEGATLPGFVAGVGWSDQWSFWKNGYDGVMITDTATFRNPSYHTPEDRPATLDYERMARVFEGIEAIVADLVR